MTTYRLYRNLTRPFELYESGDLLWLDPTEYEVEASVTLTALPAIYARHNADDRPDGQLAPSLSVGDLIALTDSPTVHAVDRYDFIALDAPIPEQVYEAGATYGEAFAATRPARAALRGR